MTNETLPIVEGEGGEPSVFTDAPEWKREFLLLSSYCGDDNDECSDARPCADCLAMCNVFDAHGQYARMLGEPRAAITKATGGDL